MGRLKVACKKAKINLSCSTLASIELEVLHEGIDFSMKFAWVKFVELNMTYFTECIKKLQTCLTDAQIDKLAVDDVILVGGSTRIPKVQCMLQEFFNGKKPYKKINPDEAVAYGAAVLAAKLCGDTTKMRKELVLVNITPLSLRTGIVGDIMSILIPRNTPIPTKKKKNFVTVADNKSSMDTTVYQGERTRLKDNYLLGKFTISGIPRAPRGVSKVEDYFEIDVNGILTVTSKVISTGETEKLTVTNHSGRLLKQEMEKMVKDAEKFKLEDEEYKRKVDAYNGLEDCLYGLKNNIKENNTPPKVFKNMKYAIEDATKWLSNNKIEVVDEIGEIESKKEYLEFISKLAFSD